MQNVEQTILSQYGNAPIINSLIQAMNDTLDPTQLVDSFYDNIMNPQTAVGYGLDVIGRIVGVDRVVQVQSGQYLGFSEASPSSGTFGNAVWYSGQKTTSNYALTDQAYRQLIYAKMLSNITDGSVEGINTILLTLFPGRGDCYCTDPGDMTMQLIFDFELLPFERSIVESSGVLPRPPGISQTIVINYVDPTGVAPLDAFYLDKNVLE